MQSATGTNKMKIVGSGNIRANETQRKRGANAAADGDFAGHMTASEGRATAGVSGTAHLGSVAALIALQANGDATKGANRAEIDRAEDLLDQLDRIRVGILTGGLSRTTLSRIVANLDERRRDGIAPRLAAVIDEIELRAKVELAKLSHD